MGLLVSAGRVATAIAAFVVLLACVGAGSSIGASYAHVDALTGAAVGAIVGLLIAGSIFGALAALFQIASATKTIVRLMEKADERATTYASVQVETLGQIAETSTRTAAALERAPRTAAR